MAKFMIPKGEAETPVRESNELFPKGVWRGKLELVRINEAVREPKSGPVFCLSEQAVFGEVGSIQLGQIEAVVDGQPEVGERKFFDDQLLFSESFGSGLVVEWDEPTGAEDENWRFQQTRRRLTNLALALGATEDDGNGGVGPVDNFGDLLRESTEEGHGLSGQDVVFEVVHRTYKTKDGTKGTAHQLKLYMPA